MNSLTDRRHADLIAAMRATHLTAPQAQGLWYIARQDLGALFAQRPRLDGYIREVGAFDAYPDLPHVLTSLNRWTDATIHLGQGESVMSDDPKELRRHLPVVLAASGRVLVTGLGLGCVVRGLLTRPKVDHIDVVEIDADVLAMVASSFAQEPRVTIHQGDAVTISWPAGTRWDFAWHDVWGEQPSTQVLHMQLIVRYRTMVRRQGAWMLPRFLKRRIALPLIDGPSHRRHLAVRGKEQG